MCPAQPKPSPAPLVVVSPLHRALRQLSVHLDEGSRQLGMHGADAHLLAYVAHYGPCPVGELARVFGHKNSTLTSILDRQERDGLVVRSPNPEDRRSFLVTATGEGEARGRRARAMVEAFEQTVLDRVSKQDLQGFGRVLAAVAAVTGVEVRQDQSNRKGKES